MTDPRPRIVDQRRLYDAPPGVIVRDPRYGSVYEVARDNDRHLPLTTNDGPEWMRMDSEQRVEWDAIDLPVEVLYTPNGWEAGVLDVAEGKPGTVEGWIPSEESTWTIEHTAPGAQVTAAVLAFESAADDARCYNCDHLLTDHESAPWTAEEPWANGCNLLISSPVFGLPPRPCVCGLSQAEAARGRRT